MNEQASRRLTLGDLPPVSVFGQNDANLRLIRDLYGARVVARGTEVLLDGPTAEVDDLAQIFEHLMSVARQGRWASPSDVRYAVRMVRGSNGHVLGTLNGDLAVRPFHGLRKDIVPKTVRQAEYIHALENNDLVFAIGPAGTGKTYLAMASALSALNRREIERIQLVRPAVDAGESLGFLPGDFTEKVAPYLRPLYDALNEMLPLDRVQKLLQNEIIEVAPLAYMRGRTLNDSIVILDEAQNTTLPQMRMALTRLGSNSKAIITGDDTQIDLARREDSALLKIQYILREVDGIRFIRFGDEDVVRHHLVQQIVQAFDAYDGRQGHRNADPSSEGGEWP